MWWDLIPDADCLGIEREYCSDDVAPGGCLMATVLDGFKAVKKPWPLKALVVM